MNLGDGPYWPGRVRINLSKPLAHTWWYARQVPVKVLAITRDGRRWVANIPGRVSATLVVDVNDGAVETTCSRPASLCGRRFANAVGTGWELRWWYASDVE
jgi:hypothetical protein